MVSTARTGQRSYDYQATGGQQGQPLAHQVPKPALHEVALHGSADCLAHDETRTCRGSVSPRNVRVHGLCLQMDNQKRATRSASSANRCREVLAPPQPILGGQHGM